MICSKCKIDKPAEAFRWRSKLRGVRHKRCKECHRGYEKALYYRSENRRADTKSRSFKQRDRIKKLLFSYLLDHPCVDCGESDPIVLEFDHINPSAKSATVAFLVSRGSTRKVFEEIDKCEVRCANCHKRRTAAQFQWAKRDYLSDFLDRKPNGEASGCNPE